MVVRKDERGLFIKVGGYIARPDDGTQYDKGQKVYARHVGGSKLVRVGRKPDQEIWYTHEAYL